jgi:WD40 repeat protein
LACGTDVGTIRLWDWRREEELASIIGSPFPSPNNDMQRIWSLAFSDDGGVLAAGCGDWSVRIVDLATRRVQNILTGHRDEVRCVAISPDGRTLASAGRDSTVKLWHLKTRKELETLKGFSFGGHACAFSPKDAILASAGVDYRILLWDLNAKMEVDAFQIETEKRFATEGSIAFSPNGEAMACRVSEANGVVKTYRTTDGKEKLCVRTGETVRCIAVSKGGVLALGGIGTIRLRSLRGNKELGDIRLNPIVVVTALDFSRDGKKLAVGGSDGSISVHSVEARETTRAVLGAHDTPVNCIAFSQDGRLLASGDSKGGILVLDAQTSEIVRRFTGHRDRVLCMAFSPDSRLLATGALEHKRALCLWNLSNAAGSPHVLMAARTVYSLRFSWDGTTLFAAHGDNTVRLWDPATGQQRLALAGHTCAVHALALSRDGNTLWSLDRYGTVRVWRAASQDEVEATPLAWRKTHMSQRDN